MANDHYVSRHVAKYRQSQVDGAKPAQILVLLFQTAVQRTKRAIIACSPDKDAERGEAVRRVLDIVIELRSTLDRDAGGEMAANLDSLYDYVITTIIDAHATRNEAEFKQALEVLDVLRDAFTQAAKHVEANPESMVAARAVADQRRADAKAAGPKIEVINGSGRRSPPVVQAKTAPTPARDTSGPSRMAEGGAPLALRRYSSF